MSRTGAITGWRWLMAFRRWRTANAESWIDDRFDYREERILTLGLNQLRVLLVVTMEPDVDVTRIISVRRAERHEEAWYYQAKS